jgi:hypothetical protein
VSLPIKPNIRLILLCVVYLVLFFNMVNLLNSLASQNMELNNWRSKTAAARTDQNNYRDEATRSLNQQLVVQSNTESLQRVSNDELVRIRSIQQNTDPNSPLPNQNNVNSGNPSLVSR